MPCQTCGGPLPAREPWYCSDHCRDEATAEIKRRADAVMGRTPQRPVIPDTYNGNRREQARRAQVRWDALYGDR
jgi:hypothetical protein